MAKDALNSQGVGPSKAAGSGTVEEADDQTLVGLAQSGDRRAFHTLMQRHQRKVYAVAYGILHDREDALDVVQETFIKVHRNLERFQGDSAFYTWVYRITANLCIDKIRRSKRHRGVSFDDGIQHDADESTPFEDDPLARFGDPTAVVRSKEILGAVSSSMDELSDNHRAVLTMRELDGMSYEEMAQAMQCSKGTIMSRLFHARKNMQRMLSSRLGMAMPVEQDSPDSELSLSRESAREAGPKSGRGARSVRAEDSTDDAAVELSNTQSSGAHSEEASQAGSKEAGRGSTRLDTTTGTAGGRARKVM